MPGAPWMNVVNSWSRWMPSMPGAPWMNVVNSWRSPWMDAINARCSLDECCEFLEVPRWMLLMPINAWCSLDECC